MDEKIIWLLTLTVLLLVKDGILPLIKRMNGKKNNPVNIDRFYQEFKDFKENQKEWNEKAEKRLCYLEKGRK